MAWFAALQVQDLAKTILRGEESVEEWADAQGNAAFPTTQEFLKGILLEIVSHQGAWQSSRQPQTLPDWACEKIPSTTQLYRRQA